MYKSLTDKIDELCKENDTTLGAIVLIHKSGISCQVHNVKTNKALQDRVMGCLNMLGKNIYKQLAKEKKEGKI